MVVDLSKFDPKTAAEKGALLELLHPGTGEVLKERGKPLTLKVLGRDAPTLRALLKETNSAVAAGEIDKEEQSIRLLVASVVGWSKSLGLNGKTLPYSPENARKLLSDPKSDWICEQIVPFSLARRNFAQNTKKN